jgi:phosphoribosylanthranilate isomerase
VRPYLKVCCIASVDEAALAIEHGASALGLVSSMPSGPGVIDDDLIAEIADWVPPPIATFLLTSSTRANDIVEHLLVTGANTVQLVDAVDNSVYREIRSETPRIRIVQVVHVTDERSIEDAVELSELVDALLLDSGKPDAEVKELGGTGRVHDWALSRRIVERSDCPVFLAGGLDPSNVRAAIETVQPFGIDLCNGVRSSGALDQAKLAALTAAMWRSA